MILSSSDVQQFKILEAVPQVFCMAVKVSQCQCFIKWNLQRSSSRKTHPGNGGVVGGGRRTQFRGADVHLHQDGHYRTDKSFATKMTDSLWLLNGRYEHGGGWRLRADANHLMEEPSNGQPFGRGSWGRLEKPRLDVGESVSGNGIQSVGRHRGLEKRPDRCWHIVRHTLSCAPHRTAPQGERERERGVVCVCPAHECVCPPIHTKHVDTPTCTQTNAKSTSTGEKKKTTHLYHNVHTETHRKHTHL